MSNEIAPTKKKKSVGAKLVLVSLGLISSLVVLEVGLRVWLSSRGTPYDSESAEREMSALVATMNESAATQGQRENPQDRPQDQAPDQTGDKGAITRVVLHPYLGFDWTHNTDIVGREVTYFANRGYEQSLNVMIFGGSVAAGFGSFGWPGLVEEMRTRQDFARRPIRVLPHGRGGFKQPQQLLNLAYLFSLGYKPDIVINLDGFNEAALASYNILKHGSPAHPSISHWAHLASNPVLDRDALDDLAGMRMAQKGAQRTIDSAIAKNLFASAFTGHLTTLSIRRQHAAYVASYENYTNRLTTGGGVTVTGPPPPEDWDAAMMLALTDWKESSRSMAALCRERGVMYLHVLQPTLHDEGSKPLTDDEKKYDKAAEGWIRGVKFAYPRMREMGTELQREGVQFLDASQVFKATTESLYYDVCHFNDAGNMILAKLIAKRLIELDEARDSAGAIDINAAASAAREAEQARIRKERADKAKARKEARNKKNAGAETIDEDNDGE